MQGVRPLICWSAILLPVKDLGWGAARRQMRCGRGVLRASSPLASHPWLLPPSLLVSLEPGTLLAGAPGDRLQMEGSGCVFCFVGWGESLNQEPIWLMKS